MFQISKESYFKWNRILENVVENIFVSCIYLHYTCYICSLLGVELIMSILLMSPHAILLLFLFFRLLVLIPTDG